MMKVFLDTNVFIEYFEMRKEKDFVAKILNAVEDGEITACTSAGSFYTMAYLVEKALKRLGIYRPKLTESLRTTLANTKKLVSLAPLSDESLTAAIADERFDDIEDAFQYHCALQNGCDVLISINKRDYARAGSEAMLVMTPREFANTFKKP